MAPKKKKAAAKKGGDDDGEIDQNTLNEILSAKVQALKARLVLEQERRDNSEAKVEEAREGAMEMDTQKNDDYQKTQTMVHKMTTIYKTMSEKYEAKIREAETEVESQNKMKKQLREEISALNIEKEEMTTKYQQDIFKLKERIDTMSTDFADMLKSTYKKMQERIDGANQTYEGDAPGGGAAAGPDFDEAPGS